MSFDGVFTHNVIHELKNTLETGRISKIQQPYDNEMILTIRGRGKNYPLLLSVHPTYARIQITKISFQNPDSPPSFCMMLRKYLDGAILEKITQVDNDRVIHFQFSKRNELGDLMDLLLIVELMGRHSTIVLVNKQTGKIIDCIKHVGPSQNTYRTLLPGSQYVHPPKQNQLNPFLAPTPTVFDLLSKVPELNPAYIQENFQGVGRDTANELVYRLQEHPNEKIPTWQKFWNQIQNAPRPTLVTDQEKSFFTPIPYLSLGTNLRSFDTYGDLLDTFYESKAEKDRVQQQVGNIIHRLRNDLKKNKGKLEKLEDSLDETENSEIYRRKGELLTTFMVQIEKGASEITLSNYYEENNPIKIKLNPAFSPAKNAQKYFQKYQKLKKSIHILKEQMEITRQEIDYISSVLSQLELASPTELDSIKEELLATGYIKEKKGIQRKKKQSSSQPQQFVSTDGTAILVGKNNLQNDQLTLKTARKNYTWLHVKDIPGSHVIIQQEKPSQQTLQEAAEIAAYFSKYRLSSSVPVDYTLVKHVHKPNGAKPGYVIYDQQKTLFVTPEESSINKMIKKK